MLKEAVMLAKLYTMMAVGAWSRKPAISWLQTRERPVVTDENKEVTSTESARRTPGCTDEPPAANETGGNPLAKFVASLKREQRRRLGELLASGAEEG
jgi:hypothetical protein